MPICFLVITFGEKKGPFKYHSHEQVQHEELGEDPALPDGILNMISHDGMACVGTEQADVEGDPYTDCKGPDTYETLKRLIIIWDLGESTCQ